MASDTMYYEVFLDRTAMPPMYGIRYGDAVSVGRLSTDFAEVDRVARLCNEGKLNTVHLRDIADDFFGAWMKSQKS